MRCIMKIYVVLKQVFACKFPHNIHLQSLVKLSCVPEYKQIIPIHLIHLLFILFIGKLFALMKSLQSSDLTSSSSLYRHVFL